MRLDAWLKDEGLTHGQFAERINTRQATVTRYANRARIPRPEQMAAIVRETDGKVGPADFYGDAPSTGDQLTPDEGRGGERQIEAAAVRVEHPQQTTETAEDAAA